MVAATQPGDVKKRSPSSGSSLTAPGGLLVSGSRRRSGRREERFSGAGRRGGASAPRSAVVLQLKWSSRQAEKKLDGADQVTRVRRTSRRNAAAKTAKRNVSTFEN